jgi:hypothetical protein
MRVRYANAAPWPRRRNHGSRRARNVRLPDACPKLGRTPDKHHKHRRGAPNPLPWCTLRLLGSARSPPDRVVHHLEGASRRRAGGSGIGRRSSGNSDAARAPPVVTALHVLSPASRRGGPRIRRGTVRESGARTTALGAPKRSQRRNVTTRARRSCTTRCTDRDRSRSSLTNGSGRGSGLSSGSGSRRGSSHRSSRSATCGSSARSAADQLGPGRSRCRGARRSRGACGRCRRRQPGSWAPNRAR